MKISLGPLCSPLSAWDQRTDREPTPFLAAFLGPLCSSTPTKPHSTTIYSCPSLQSVAGAGELEASTAALANGTHSSKAFAFKVVEEGQVPGGDGRC